MSDTPEVGSTDLIVSDAGAVYDAVITSLEESVAEPLYPGDERRIFGEALAAVIASINGTIRDAARQTMLRYARGEVLDALGARLRVERLPGEPSRTVLEFALGAPREEPTDIPAGTRATPDGAVYFATDEAVTVPAGQLTATAAASCTEAGFAANGYGPGAIATMVDLVPYVATVRNIEASHGGDDGEPYDEEGDARLRERVRSATSGLSTAGPEKGYAHWAMSADAGISDAAAVSETERRGYELPLTGGRLYLGGDLLLPETLLVDGSADGFAWTYENSLLTVELAEGHGRAEGDEVPVSIERKMDGRVRIIVLMEGGGGPDEDTRQKVLEAVSASDVRPLTDLVEVTGPDLVPYDIELVYWTDPADEAAVVQAVEGPGGAIERYRMEQDSVLGRDINPDMLERYVMRPDWAEGLKGAIRVDVLKPEHQSVDGGQAALFSGSLKVSHKVTSLAGWSE